MFVSPQEPLSFSWRQLVQVSVCQKGWPQKRRSLSSARQEGRQQSVQNTMYVLFVTCCECYGGTYKNISLTVCFLFILRWIFCPWIISRKMLNGVLSTRVLLFPCSSQCQAWVPWCLQWTLVRSHCFLTDFIQKPCWWAVFVHNAKLLLCYTFIYVCVCVCVYSLVRMSCLPFTLTLNTLVSLWAPGTHGTENRIKQVRTWSIS